MVLEGLKYYTALVRIEKLPLVNKLCQFFVMFVMRLTFACIISYMNYFCNFYINIFSIIFKVLFFFLPYK